MMLVAHHPSPSFANFVLAGAGSLFVGSSKGEAESVKRGGQLL